MVANLSLIMMNTGIWISKENNKVGFGSCWAVGKDLVITNFHVASAGLQAAVRFPDGREIEVIGLSAVDKERDITCAKIKVSGKPLDSLNICEWIPHVGSDVYVIGSPAGLQNTVTRGIISAVRSAEELRSFGFNGRMGDRFIQIDAPLHPGCSGGPVVDTLGQVVGVSCFGLGNTESLNFIIPAAYVKELLKIIGKPRPLCNFAKKDKSENIPMGQRTYQPGLSEELTLCDCLFRFFGTLIGADDDITDEELEAVFEILGEYGFSAKDIKASIDKFIFENKIKSKYKLLLEAILYVQENLDEKFKSLILKDLCRIALADGFSSEELVVIEFIKEKWKTLDE